MTYHISSNGEPAVCRAASPESCPLKQALGGEQVHGSLQQVTAVIEARNRAASTASSLSKNARASINLRSDDADSPVELAASSGGNVTSLQAEVEDEYRKIVSARQQTIDDEAMRDAKQTVANRHAISRARAAGDAARLENSRWSADYLEAVTASGAGFDVDKASMLAVPGDVAHVKIKTAYGWGEVQGPLREWTSEHGDVTLAVKYDETDEGYDLDATLVRNGRWVGDPDRVKFLSIEPSADAVAEFHSLDEAGGLQNGDRYETSGYEGYREYVAVQRDDSDRDGGDGTGEPSFEHVDVTWGPFPGPGMDVSHSSMTARPDKITRAVGPCGRLWHLERNRALAAAEDGRNAAQQRHREEEDRWEARPLHAKIADALRGVKSPTEPDLAAFKAEVPSYESIRKNGRGKAAEAMLAAVRE